MGYLEVRLSPQLHRKVKQNERNEIRSKCNLIFWYSLRDQEKDLLEMFSFQFSINYSFPNNQTIDLGTGSFLQSAIASLLSAEPLHSLQGKFLS